RPSPVPGKARTPPAVTRGLDATRRERKLARVISTAFRDPQMQGDENHAAHARHRVRPSAGTTTDGGRRPGQEDGCAVSGSVASWAGRGSGEEQSHTRSSPTARS